MTAWLNHARCPTCMGVLDLGPSSGLALCDCGQSILVEREVTVRWRVTVAPVLEPSEARESFVDAVVRALGKRLARELGWVA